MGRVLLGPVIEERCCLGSLATLTVSVVVVAGLRMNAAIVARFRLAALGYGLSTLTMAVVVVSGLGVYAAVIAGLWLAAFGYQAGFTALLSVAIVVVSGLGVYAAVIAGLWLAAFEKCAVIMSGLWLALGEGHGGGNREAKAKRQNGGFSRH